MTDQFQKPDIGRFPVKSEKSRQVASVSFMTICVATATLALVVLMTLLVSIGAKGIRALGPREDKLPNRLKLNFVQGSGAKNDPESLDRGDFVLGVYVIDRIDAGGLGNKNDIEFAANKSNPEAKPVAAPRIGIFSFQVTETTSDDESSSVDFEAAHDSNSVESILLAAGCNFERLNQKSVPRSAIALLETSDNSLNVSDILDQFDDLTAQGIAASLRELGTKWDVKLMAGLPAEQDFFRLRLRSGKYLQVSEITKLRMGKKFGQFDGCFSAMAHDLKDHQSFQSIAMNSPIIRGGLVKGDFLWRRGQLQKLRSTYSPAEFSGDSQISFNVLPEAESAADYLAHFLTAPPVNHPYDAGIGPALMGTVWVCIGCALFALPLGIGTAIFLEEMQPTGKWTRRFHGFVQLNISNLAGVPSIVYGLLGLIAFGSMLNLFGSENNPSLEIGATHQFQYLTEGNIVVLMPAKSRDDQPVLTPGTLAAIKGDGQPIELNIIGENDPFPEDESVIKRTLYADAEGGPVTRTAWYYFRLPFGRGVLAASLTLMLVILPVIIIASQESLRAVPSSLREAALGVGATQWQVIRSVTLPAAVPGIMTGAILSTSRAIGEAAPLLVLAGIVYITSGPSHLMDFYSVMPIQIFYWAGLPVDRTQAVNFQHVAALGIMILLGILLTFNAIAIGIRQWTQKPLT